MPNTAERVAPHTGKFEFKLFVAAGHTGETGYNGATITARILRPSFPIG